MFRSIVAAALLVFAGTANSAVLYTYQGQPLTNSYSYTVGSGDFDSADFSGLGGTPTAITASILLAQPIPECDRYCRYSFGYSNGEYFGPPSGLIDFAFSDGLTIFSSLADLVARPDYFVHLSLTADSDGVVDYWLLGVRSDWVNRQPYTLWYFATANQNPSDGGDPLGFWTLGMTAFGDTSSYCGAQDGVYGCFDSNPLLRTDSLGSWSTTVVPIPPAVWLFGSALGVMGVMRRKVSS